MVSVAITKGSTTVARRKAGGSQVLAAGPGRPAGVGGGELFPAAVRHHLKSCTSCTVAYVPEKRSKFSVRTDCDLNYAETGGLVRYAPAQICAHLATFLSFFG